MRIVYQRLLALTQEKEAAYTEAVHTYYKNHEQLGLMDDRRRTAKARMIRAERAYFAKRKELITLT